VIPRREATLYTIGHSNRDASRFINLLEIYRVKILIDVRRYPHSRKYPHFNKEHLEKILLNKGIIYYWLGKELGGWRKYKGESISGCLKSPGFRAYVEHMKTEVFKRGISVVIKLAKKDVTAIMCAEKFPWKCHRYFISDWLLVHGFRIIHIIDEHRTIVHKLSRCAKIVDGELVYY